MIIGIADEYFDVILALFEEAGHSIRLIKAGVESRFILKLCDARPEPGESFVSEGIYHFDFVVIGVSHQYYVLLGDEVHAHGVLQLGFSANTIEVSISMEVAWVVISANYTAR